MLFKRRGNPDYSNPLPVSYELRASILRKIDRGEDVLPDIDGREETKKDVIRAILSGSHLYLVSEEGTGKTRLARSIAKLLPPTPVIRGCPYNDHPGWPPELLCPRCRSSKEPARKFGVELLPGPKRFSRVQGNEYTNEAKLLGLKDIQAIAHGKSPSDPSVFTGTGVFRANRGILFIDELPAIRTKIQVLLHPILEEKKAILEEYNWEHPLDLILIATGNPYGFAHVNEIPRPLLDRLELIYMDLPEEKVEEEIILKERFKVQKAEEVKEEKEEYPTLEEAQRRAVTPWWIIEIINKAVRYSRICPFVERKPSIRATLRALDHTCSSAELERKKIACLKHAYYGLRLALRGRIGLRPDLVDFENPKRTFNLCDTLAEDFLWNILENMAQEQFLLRECNREKLSAELNNFFMEEQLPEGRLPKEMLSKYPEIERVISWMKNCAAERVNQNLLNEMEKRVFLSPEDTDFVEEYNFSAFEILVNVAVHSRLINEAMTKGIYIPKKFRR